jgi:flagellar assembly protein FliH
MTDRDSLRELIRAKELGEVNLWTLPRFDDDPEADEEQVPQVLDETVAESEEVAPEDVKPLTLDELEAIRQDAYNEGFSTGERDGFHAGQLKARQEAEETLSEKLKTLEQLMSNLFEPIAGQDQQIEEALLQLLVKATREVIQRELSLDSSQIRQVLSEALKLLPMGVENIRIFLNPQDFEQIKSLRERHEENWRIIGDDSLLPGGCRVETEHSRLDASIEARAEQLFKQLFAQRLETAATPAEADLPVAPGDLRAP